MNFEAAGEKSFNVKSPGGFQFGVQGWTYSDPIPKSITFFLDGSAMVCDQYGRPIRRAIHADGSELAFADRPPEGTKEGHVVARPQYATHAQVVAALTAERIDWLAYEVRYRSRDGSEKMRGNLSLADAAKLQQQLLKDGNNPVILGRMISCAGWPQLPYDELKKLPELPPTPIDELKKILDTKLRKDALRIKREVDSAREKELQAIQDE